jgi:hypothetical protein
MLVPASAKRQTLRQQARLANRRRARATIRLHRTFSTWHRARTRSPDRPRSCELHTRSPRREAQGHRVRRLLVHVVPFAGRQARGRKGRPWKERLIREGNAHAALVFDGYAAVAWAQYGSPEELPNVHHRKDCAGSTSLPRRLRRQWPVRCAAPRRDRPKAQDRMTESPARTAVARGSPRRSVLTWLAHSSLLRCCTQRESRQV